MEKKPKITLSNILSFVEGNTQLLLERLHIQQQHIREQIAYRRLLCADDCAVQNKCVYCGCDFEGKSSTTQSCNKGERFPNLMSKPRWEKFKIDNGIE